LDYKIAAKKGGNAIMGRKDTVVIRVNKDFANHLRDVQKKTGKSINELTRDMNSLLRVGKNKGR